MTDAGAGRSNLAAFLIGLSLSGLLVGAIFPVAAKLHNPFFGYFIVFISWPTWLMGTVAGAAGFLKAGRMDPPRRTLARWGLVLCVGNMAAAVLVFLVPFHAS